MKAKEKAEELIKNYDNLLFSEQGKFMNISIKCAIICVDEIIENIKFIFKSESMMKFIPIGEINYWQEVKRELKIKK